MAISKRLKSIIELVTTGLTVADIGTDHGYVPISLLREGKVPRAIAVDVSRGSLEKAVQNAWRAGIRLHKNEFLTQAATALPDLAAALRVPDGEAAKEESYLQRISPAGRKTGSGLIEFRLSDGLAALKPGEAECMVISGMGGILMTNILLEYPDVFHSAKELIVSPHRDAELVREVLSEHGFHIILDMEIQDKKKRYPVMKAVRETKRSVDGTKSSIFHK